MSRNMLLCPETMLSIHNTAAMLNLWAGLPAHGDVRIAHLYDPSVFTPSYLVWGLVWGFTLFAEEKNWSLTEESASLFNQFTHKIPASLRRWTYNRRISKFCHNPRSLTYRSIQSFDLGLTRNHMFKAHREVSHMMCFIDVIETFSNSFIVTINKSISFSLILA